MCRVHSTERVEVPLALTTPERFEDALRTHAGATIAAEASELVGKLDPTLSARGGPTSRETLIGLVVSCRSRGPRLDLPSDRRHLPRAWLLFRNPQSVG